MADIITNANGILHSDSPHGPGISKIPLRNLLELFRTLVLCVGQATEDGHQLLKNEFPGLTMRLAGFLKAVSYLPYPSAFDVNDSDVVRCQCALDMAMRVHKRAPDTIDKSLFEALHECSVKMFDLMVEGSPYLDSCIQRKEDTSQAEEALAEVTDWEKVLAGEGEYLVGVDARGGRRNGQKWDYEMLRRSCKYRLKFMLQHSGGWSDVFRSELDDFRF